MDVDVDVGVNGFDAHINIDIDVGIAVDTSYRLKIGIISGEMNSDNSSAWFVFELIKNVCKKGNTRGWNVELIFYNDTPFNKYDEITKLVKEYVVAIGGGGGNDKEHLNQNLNNNRKENININGNRNGNINDGINIINVADERYRNIFQLDTLELFSMIKRDKIDILIDCNTHGVYQDNNKQHQDRIQNNRRNNHNRNHNYNHNQNDNINHNNNNQMLEVKVSITATRHDVYTMVPKVDPINGKWTRSSIEFASKLNTGNRNFNLNSSQNEQFINDDFDCVLTDIVGLTFTKSVNAYNCDLPHTISMLPCLARMNQISIGEQNTNRQKVTAANDSNGSNDKDVNYIVFGVVVPELTCINDEIIRCWLKILYQTKNFHSRLYIKSKDFIDNENDNSCSDNNKYKNSNKLKFFNRLQSIYFNMYSNKRCVKNDKNIESIESIDITGNSIDDDNDTTLNSKICKEFEEFKQRVKLIGFENKNIDPFNDYNKFDVCLDCFPLSNKMANLDGLLMSVPTIVVKNSVGAMINKEINFGWYQNSSV